MWAWENREQMLQKTLKWKVAMSHLISLRKMMLHFQYCFCLQWRILYLYWFLARRLKELRCLPANCPKVLSHGRGRPRYFALIERYFPKWACLIANVPESLYFPHIRFLLELPAKCLSRAAQQQETVAGLFEILYQSRCAAWACSFSNLMYIKCI